MTDVTDYEKLGPLPESWKNVALKEVVSKLVDGSHNPPSKKDSGFPMLSARNIENNQIVFDNFRFISEDDFEKEHGRTRIESGDVLLTIVGTIGRSAVVPAGLKDFALQRSVAVLTPHGVLSKYLMYQLQAPFIQRHFIKNARGTAQKGVYLKTLGQTPIRVAPLEQQKRIVAEIEKQFSRLDEAVANLKRVKANLKRYKAAVLKAAVEGRIVATDTKYDHVPLKNLIGRIHQGWSPKCNKNREPVPNEWAVITTTAVQPMQYLDGHGKPLPNYLEPRPHLEVKSGDFLVTRKGPRVRAGVACLVRRTRHRLMVCDTVYRFRCDESKVIPAYLEIALNAPSVVSAIDRQKAGINESGVSLTHSKLGGIKIPVPPLENQSWIVIEVERHLSILRETEAQVDANLLRAERMRQSILSKAFSGGLNNNPKEVSSMKECT